MRRIGPPSSRAIRSSRRWVMNLVVSPLRHIVKIWRDLAIFQSLDAGSISGPGAGRWKAALGLVAVSCGGRKSTCCPDACGKRDAQKNAYHAGDGR
jgi:hypothetical protein